MSLRIEQNGRLCRITLSSPEKRNTLDAAGCRELLSEIRNAAADPATGAVLLDADGPVFCAGADDDTGELFEIGKTIAKPLVVAVQGICLSGGLALAANAHVVVAAQGTSFGLVGVREGKWDDPIFRAVASALGERRALELALTTRIFSTPEALAWGLVQYVAPAFELDDRATELATALANSNPEAISKALPRSPRSNTPND